MLYLKTFLAIIFGVFIVAPLLFLPMAVGFASHCYNDKVWPWQWIYSEYKIYKKGLA